MQQGMAHAYAGYVYKYTYRKIILKEYPWGTCESVQLLVHSVLSQTPITK